MTACAANTTGSTARPFESPALILSLARPIFTNAACRTPRAVPRRGGVERLPPLALPGQAKTIFTKVAPTVRCIAYCGPSGVTGGRAVFTSWLFRCRRYYDCGGLRVPAPPGRVWDCDRGGAPNRQASRHMLPQRCSAPRAFRTVPTRHASPVRRVAGRVSPLYCPLRALWRHPVTSASLRVVPFNICASALFVICLSYLMR